MAKQHQHASTHEQPARNGSKAGGQCAEADPLRDPLRQHRQQRHGGKGLEREHPAHALVGQSIERQVDQEKNQAEVPAGGVVQQEGQAGRTTGQQAGMTEHDHAQGDKQRAREQGLRVLVQLVLGR
ncbi:hypothetical protein D9M68_847230 [compost metagenome]